MDFFYLSLGCPTTRNLFPTALQPSFGSKSCFRNKSMLEENFTSAIKHFTEPAVSMPREGSATQETNKFFNRMQYKLEPSYICTFPNQKAVTNTSCHDAFAEKHVRASPFKPANKRADRSEEGLINQPAILGAQDIACHANLCTFRNTEDHLHCQLRSLSSRDLAPSSARSAEAGVPPDFRTALLLGCPAPPTPPRADGEKISPCPELVRLSSPQSYAARLMTGLPVADPAESTTAKSQECAADAGNAARATVARSGGHVQAYGWRKRPCPTDGRPASPLRTEPHSIGGGGAQSPIVVAATAGGDGRGWKRSRSAAIAVAQLIA